MSAVAAILFIGMTLSGHLALWVFLYNRLHATGLPRRFVRVVEKLIILFVGVSGVGLLALMLAHWPTVIGGTAAAPTPWLTWYAIVAGVALALVSTKWLVARLRPKPVSPLVSNHTERLNVAAHLGMLPVGRVTTRFAASLPGNQVMRVQYHHKTLCHPRLPSALDGLRIAQLSDLHMTGQLTIEFFQTVVAHTNRWSPDVVVLTGDLIEKTPCLDWIATTLGKLQTRYGKYFILGNHDRRLPDSDAVRRGLTALGWQDLGSRWQPCQWQGAPVLMAGNESPWFAAPKVAERPTLTDADAPFSILLSHSPDQLPWARAACFDLMLAGHTHGGQIRLPVIGPMVCPSRYGVKYAAGVFHEPPTIMHVSRGLSGVQPLRFGCPPEVTLLELRTSGLRNATASR